jgi:hypothetical protein
LTLCVLLARAIDLAYDAFSVQPSRFGDPDEFVPHDAAKANVAAHQLQVRFAQSGV